MKGGGAKNRRLPRNFMVFFSSFLSSSIPSGRIQLFPPTPNNDQVRAEEILGFLSFLLIDFWAYLFLIVFCLVMLKLIPGACF